MSDSSNLDSSDKEIVAKRFPAKRKNARIPEFKEEEMSDGEEGGSASTDNEDNETEDKPSKNLRLNLLNLI